jgi:hypothetical protein
MAFDRKLVIPAFELECDEVTVKFSYGYPFDRGRFSSALRDWLEKHKTKRIIDVQIVLDTDPTVGTRTMVGVILFVDAESSCLTQGE